MHRFLSFYFFEMACYEKKSLNTICRLCVDSHLMLLIDLLAPKEAIKLKCLSLMLGLTEFNQLWFNIQFKFIDICR